jgi:hypothetical protein
VIVAILVLVGAQSSQLGFLVPVTMVERFDGFRRLQTEATYSDFCRFDVATRIK